jgi:uncharacterized membrane protein
MFRTPAIFASAALILAMAAGGFWALRQLPPDATIAVHFTANGTPNGWARATVGLFILPAVAAFTTALAFVLPRIDPRAQNLQVSARSVQTIIAAINATLALFQFYLIKSALGAHFATMTVVALAIGLLFVVIGNVMGKLRWNYTVGIRTPWTLDNERVWDKTHRFGGWVFVASGLLLVALALVAPSSLARPALFATIVGVTTVLPIAQSYLLWRQQQN